MKTDRTDTTENTNGITTENATDENSVEDWLDVPADLRLDADDLSYDDPSYDDAFDQDLEDAPEPVHQVEVRRNGSLAAVVGSVAAVVAVAYLLRGATSGSLVDWLVFVVIGAVALVHAAAFLDAKTPLLVADETGIRIRLGRSWQGLPWEDVEEVEHAPRHTLLRDGRLVAFPRDPEAVLAGLDATARRQAAISERVHGAPFAVPLGVTTRVVGAPEGLTTALLALAPHPDLVVEVTPSETDWLDDEPWALATDSTDSPDQEHPDHQGEVGGGRVDDQDGSSVAEPSDAEDLSDTAERPAYASASGVARSEDEDGREETAIRPRPVVASQTPSPLRHPVAAMRAEVTRQISRHRENPAGGPLVAGSSALAHDVDEQPVRVLPELEQLRREAADYFSAGPDDTGVWRSTTVVIDGLAGPSVEPVIGPQLANARRALGLDVDRLAERTRIRPHVIEAIEIDDFGPCGGDFYARGHLRTLARVLGVEAPPLLATYDEVYAEAPIEARRVFEAELATGSDGAIRSLRGGPNWSVLVAAVMALVLAWSVARLIVDRPEDGKDDSPGIANGSAGLSSADTVAPVPVVLTAEGGGAKVVVRDADGTVVFKGNLAFGQSRTVKASPPVSVQTSDGSLTVGIAGQQAESMGRTGKSARDTFVPKAQ